MRKVHNLRGDRGDQTSQRLSTKHKTVSLVDVVSLRDMKEFAKKLPMTSKARELILDMDDSMPRWEVLEQLMVISKILDDDLKKH